MAVFNNWDEYLRAVGEENLITNGNFPDNVDGWVIPSNASIEWSSGHAVFTQTESYRSAKQVISVESGQAYELSADVHNGTVEGRVFAVDSNSNYSEVITEGGGSIQFTPKSNSITVYFGGLSGSGNCTFDNISLRPV